MNFLGSIIEKKMLFFQTDKVKKDNQDKYLKLKICRISKKKIKRKWTQIFKEVLNYVKE